MNSTKQREVRPGEPSHDIPAGRSSEAAAASPKTDATAGSRGYRAQGAEFSSNPDHNGGTRGHRQTPPFRELLQRLHRDVEFAQGVLVSTMPRGGFQVIAPEHADDNLVRGLSRTSDAFDRVTWKALLTDEPASSETVWSKSELKKSPFGEQVLQPANLGSHVAVPVKDPLLPGYAGALVLFREATAAAFTASELEKVAAFARDIEKHLRRKPAPPAPMAHELSTPMFVFGPDAQVLYPQGGLEALVSASDRLRSQIEQHVRKSLEKRDTDAAGKRLVFPDDRGDLWVFRLRRIENYPALTHAAGLKTDGPVVFLMHLPAPADFAAVRPEDLAADDEVSRLVPALQFMYEKHREGPTLDTIARHVHLSPFHFHRRFTELLGLTPKHYLFDCQIDTAKRQLAAGVELAEIAKHCGFAHQSHFTSRFKQATGLTPTRWRKLATSNA